ncbi:MAG: monofunctional biosynthetic peptidoglycan transglycosylase, partial [Thermaurantiacus sp.]
MIRRLVRATVLLGLALVALSVLWAGVLRWFNPPTTWVILRDRVQGLEVTHRPVPLAAISPNMVRAVIAAEDSGFCTHRGFDVEAIEAAKAETAAGRRLRGGSTISQQTAKNIFLWHERTWLRKGLEAWFTILIEGLWGKPRIMEMYLNHIEFAPGVWGVEAAAAHHFGTTAARLTANQAARLAVVLPQPSVRNAGRPGPFVRRFSGTIERRMAV